MNKSSLKTFAIESRNDLRDKVEIKLEILGIKPNSVSDVTSHGSVVSINGFEYNKGQYDSLIKKYNELGYTELVEEVAYTWFNRLVAIGYMEYNGYIDEKIISSTTSKVEPDIIDNYFEADFFEDLDSDLKDKIHDLKDNHKSEEMYTLLVEGKCQELSKIMPFMFEAKADYTELLFPSGLLLEGSFLTKLRVALEESKETVGEEELIPVELIGWLYQFYNSEKKDEVFEGLKKNKKITKENIPAATQLFTPKWIVKYMVENSLGKLAVESLGASEELKKRWKYYIEPTQTPPSDTPRAFVPSVGHGFPSQGAPSTDRLAIEDIKILDPAMGSGHMLTYSFDVLYDIYEDLGWTTKDAVLSILKNNIYGLEIDDRAGMLASFAIMMKAREKFRRLFRVLGRLDEEDKFSLNTLAIQESNGIGEQTLNLINSEELVGLNSLISTFKDAKEYGSILKLESIDSEQLIIEKEKLREAYKNQGQMGIFAGTWNFDEDLELIKRLIHQGVVMASKYDVTITNPPYMGGKGYTPTLKKYVEKNYKDSKMDLFAVFMEKCGEYTKQDGYTAMIVMQSWMFLSSFEKLRTNLIETKKVESMLHLGYGAIGIAFGTTAFCFRNSFPSEEKGDYFRLFDKMAQNIDTENIAKIYQETVKNTDYKFNFDDYSNKEELELNHSEGKQIRYQTKQKDFEKIPGSPIAYWVSNQILKAFIEGNDFPGNTKKGVLTGNDSIFVKDWFEINDNNIGKNIKSHLEMVESKKKWFPVTSGGLKRKWYGNFENVVNLENDGEAIKRISKNYRLRESVYYMREALTWTEVSSGAFSCRYVPQGILFGNGGPVSFFDDNIYNTLSLLNSKLTMKILSVLAPTINFGPEQVKRIPFLINHQDFIKKLTKENISISKQEWNSRETSWDFTENQVISKDVTSNKLEDGFSLYEKEWREKFFEMHSNEEELNRLFIEIYGLQEEMDEKVELKDITLLKKEAKLLSVESEELKVESLELNQAEKEQGKVLVFDRNELVKQFISYAVGCIMGRYSIDKEGLIIANSDDELAASHGKLHIVGSDNEDRHTIENPRFIPDAFGVIPITTEANVFDNDIVTRVVEFVKTVYGEDTLEENLNFIATHLGMKATESSRECIRRYFVKCDPKKNTNFYGDHCQRYKKKPIYWMVNSGKKDGFNALIYMHRYRDNTVARIRTDYLNRYQEILENIVSSNLRSLEDVDLKPKEKKSLEKEIKVIDAQIEELKKFAGPVKDLADKKINIDLDDGVKVNYEKFKGILKKI